MVGLDYISIIITTYNSAQTIELVVNYILANITDNDQIVIVDDGSSDDTVKKIKNIRITFHFIFLDQNTG